MSKRLLIIGAGGFGREVLAWAEDVQQSEPGVDWQVGGFLDSNPEALAGFAVGLPIVGDPQSYQPEEDDRFICAIGDPQTKLEVCHLLRGRGARFINLIHPTATIGARCRFGEGIILCPKTILTVDVSIEDFVTLNCHAGVGHDAVVGEGSTLGAFCDVTGGATLGRAVYMGSHAVVAPRVRVGAGTLIGAGSVAIRRTRERTSVIGVPAKRIGFERRAG